MSLEQEGSPASANVEPQEDDLWDAGGMGCGDLVIELRRRMRTLPEGGVLLLIAEDGGAPEDIPAWCRLTGHALVAARHPRYWIRRKGST